MPIRWVRADDVVMSSPRLPLPPVDPSLVDTSVVGTCLDRRRRRVETASEASLVAAAQDGDRRALDQLLRIHQPQVHRICRRMMGHETDALDASQQALMAIVGGLARFDRRSRFTTWLYRVTTNACLDELRRRRRRPVLARDDRDVVVDLLDDRARPVADVVADQDLVERSLAELTEAHRVVLVLREICQLDYAEIADVLGLPVGTVRSRLSRARSTLADVGTRPLAREALAREALTLAG